MSPSAAHDVDAGAVVIAALRAQLGTGELPPLGGLSSAQWERVALLAKHHAVGGLVHCALATHPGEGPPEVRKRMELAYHAAALRGATARALVGEIADAFERGGVRCVLLKGAALLHGLYEDVGLRRIGDLDLLVAERALEDAIERLRAIGFQQPRAPVKAHWPSCAFHVIFNRAGARSIPVEVHWGLFEGFQPYVFDLAQVHARAVRVPTLPAAARVMAPEHELAHLCLHLERHAMVYESLLRRGDWRELLLMPQGEARLLWLYDVGMYLTRRAAVIDWDRFVTDARGWAVGGRIGTVLAACERALGAGPPPDIARALGRTRLGPVERATHRLIIAAHRGREAAREDAGPPAAHWREVLADRAMGWWVMWQSVFPPADYLRARYSRVVPLVRLRLRHARAMLPEISQAVRRRLGAVGHRAGA